MELLLKGDEQFKHLAPICSTMVFERNQPIRDLINFFYNTFDESLLYKKTEEEDFTPCMSISASKTLKYTYSQYKDWLTNAFVIGTSKYDELEI